ncbi:MAG: hypothetical protein IJ423_04840 [Clostridia bacterium]|nr:hypothetical protein [Clostridia bacterium]
MNNVLNPCILQTIIICITVIALGIIGVAAYRIRKGLKRSWASYIFLASIFITIAVVIFSLCFSKHRNILDFISLASAIVSIILAVITIVYSYFINSRSSGQIDQLNKAAQDVSKATLSYTQSAESLQENIQKIINAINRVEEKTDKLLNENTTKNLNQNNVLNNFDLDAYMNGFINTASVLGILMLYACVKAKDCNKPFDLNMLGEENAIYCMGFFIATVSTGLINGFIDFNTKKITTKDYIPNFKNIIKKWIDDNDDRPLIKEVKPQIDSFFE